MKFLIANFIATSLLISDLRASAGTFYVNASNATPVSPFSSWITAATNIQDAIDAAAAGDTVVVTNGVYSFGGKALSGVTNRVALTKAVIVTSANGYATTVIQGAWDPVFTNGPAAVRCAYLTNGAVLNGFTLENGATPNGGFGGNVSDSGGGAFCVSTNAVISNCVLTNNTSIFGGGICNGTLNNSLVIGNWANYGAGAYSATLNNCTVVENIIPTSISYNNGSGTYNCVVRNSIVLYNLAGSNPSISGPGPNYFSTAYTYSCSDPLISGTGNIDANPQFLDWFHIAATSPCFGAGNTSYTIGTDLDGEPWLNPPSMGCDEVIASNLIGMLSVNLVAVQTNLLVNRFDGFSGTIAGRATRIEWLFGDGPIITNLGINTGHTWINSGNYPVTFTAYNNDNPSGVSTNIIVHIEPIIMPQLEVPKITTNKFQFQFFAQTNANYTVQFTTNLIPPVTWQTLQTIYFNNASMIQITDLPTNSIRFYRILAQ
jgi:hypothetical protein